LGTDIENMSAIPYILLSVPISEKIYCWIKDLLFQYWIRNHFDILVYSHFTLAPYRTSGNNFSVKKCMSVINTDTDADTKMDIGYLYKVQPDIQKNDVLCPLASNIGCSNIMLSPISFITDIGMSAYLCQREMFEGKARGKNFCCDCPFIIGLSD
jgi:hypothetical protein